MTNTQSLPLLRKYLHDQGCHGFILPVTDEYQGEYNASYARRVTWLTGFDGSAGMLVVLPDKAALLVDGRYTLQAKQEVDTTLYEVHHSATTPLHQYLCEHISAPISETAEPVIIGYDPWLHTVTQMQRLQKALPEHFLLRALTHNLVDLLWTDRPSRPTVQLRRHDSAIAGMETSDKLAKVIQSMQADALMLNEPDAICWLLNIRGGDVPYNPLPLCYAVIMRDGTVSLIIHPEKTQHIALDSNITVIDEQDIEAFVASLPVNTVQYDPSTCPVRIMQLLEKGAITPVAATNPVTLLKAVKNPVEVRNMQRAHCTDGYALTRFIEWFHALPEEASLTERDVVAKLEAFRRENPDYLGASFATIAGAGEHGAIVHYHATEATNRAIRSGDALLIDSGGQYSYGTTDVTRTLVRGKPSDAFRHHFTLVLKGHIALAQAIFPEGTTGHQLDVLARQFLWQEGEDYQHGTGHGVGHYLCVHEGPQNISTRPNNVALQPGMILSNEPGYYKTGHYGIRIESLVLVVEKYCHDDGKRYFGFETLTRVPIDMELADISLLSAGELAWLETYHQLCEENAT